MVRNKIHQSLMLHLLAEVPHRAAEAQHGDAAAGVVAICRLHLEGCAYAEAVLCKIGQRCMPAGRLQRSSIFNHT